MHSLTHSLIFFLFSFFDKKSHSVSAFVASTNDTYTQWYSKAVVQNRNEEMVHGLVVSLQYALAAYKKHNNKYPQKIIIFRYVNVNVKKETDFSLFTYYYISILL